MIRPGIFAGSSVRVTARFLDPDSSVPIEVTGDVIAEIRPPDNDDGTERPLITETATEVAPGTYQASFVATWPGRYVVKTRSTGPDPAVAWDEVEIRSSTV